MSIVIFKIMIRTFATTLFAPLRTPLCFGCLHNASHTKHTKPLSWAQPLGAKPLFCSVLLCSGWGSCSNCVDFIDKLIKTGNRSRQSPVGWNDCVGLAVPGCS